MNHRWGQRIPVDVAVRLTSRFGAVGAGRLQEISMSGGYVQTGLRLPPLTQLCVAFDDEEIQGWVVHGDANGLGVAWNELVPAACRAFQSGVSDSRDVPLQSGPRILPAEAGADALRHGT